MPHPTPSTAVGSDPAESSLVLKLSGITRRFGSVLANDAIDLDLHKGEVLALLGENGAGKTTLMNILFGHYTADSGHIEVAGPDGTMTPLPPGNPAAALKAGIGMVHQHFTLAENLSAFDNIVLGTERLWRPTQQRRNARSKLTELMTGSGLTVDLSARIGALSVGEQQRVEILKALYREARVLILDEPTAVLTPQETNRLFETLRRLAATGLAVVFISHKLNEVMAISDRVTVLRGGRVAATLRTAETDRHQLAETMVGRSIPVTSRTPMTPGAAVLSLENVHVDVEAGRVPLTGIDLTIHRHEIVGIAGVSGNGQTALSDLLAGLAHPNRGTASVFGRPMGNPRPRDMVRAGVGRIPEDRHRHGVVGDMALWETVLLEDYALPAFQWLGLVRRDAARTHAAKLIDRYDVRCPGPEAVTRLLSGGNIQKLILGRVLDREPGLILANQPTRGLDIGSVTFVHSQLLAARSRGAGIVLISEDLDELLTLSDRIAVIYQGRLSAPYPTEDVTVRGLGLLMAGHDAAAGGIDAA